MQLFWSKGYEATSLQELLAATGLSKSSLYESFGNKQSLFEAAFSRYFDARAKQMYERLGQARSPLSFIHDCLLSVVEEVGQGTPRGCMLVNVANEFSTSDPSVRGLIELATRRFRQVFERAFEQAQACGQIGDSHSPDSLALYTHCVMVGLRTQVKSGLPKQELLIVVDLAMANFKGFGLTTKT
ncbi:HTH-type transcriptional repressor ComR [Pseudomonas sp. SCT]|uniref:TetR/AcrR family transcriptional regulator n=1 Tax=Pseudomonas sp. (strain SCT) TaxID=412955 RepID=UPI000EC9A59F|nr:TetR/AcrR family transcriptional regulator [Pseudomonas sp. SCT]GCA58188.1 HTH-type transcriptional repressor ComR [Pseudomonas sp. SCT]